MGVRWLRCSSDTWKIMWPTNQHGPDHASLFSSWSREEKKRGKKVWFSSWKSFYGCLRISKFQYVYIYSYNKALRNDTIKTPALGPRLAGECSLGMQSLGFCPYYQTGKQQTVTNFPPLFFKRLKTCFTVTTTRCTVFPRSLFDLALTRYSSLSASLSFP